MKQTKRTYEEEFELDNVYNESDERQSQATPSIWYN